MAVGPSRGVFVSYSHNDSEWLTRLQTHLKPLVRDGKIEYWDDTQIAAGADWREEIEDALSSARVAIVLVSADFLGSDFIANNELPSLLDSAANAGTVILPLIVAPSRFRESPLSRFQAINPPERPLTSLEWWESEDYLVKASRDVEQALGEVAPRPDGAPPPVDEPDDTTATERVPVPDGPQDRPPELPVESEAVAAPEWRLDEVRELVGGGHPVFSPDGQKIGIAYGIMLQVVEVASDGLTKLPSPNHEGLAAGSQVFSHDGFSVAAAARVARTGAPSAWVWDRDTGELLCEVESQGYGEMAGPLVFSPTGAHFTAPMLSPAVWDTGAWERVWDSTEVVLPVTAFGALGDWFATATGSLVAFWDLPEPGEAFKSEHAGDASITGIEAHPVDPSLLLSVSATDICLHRRDEGLVWNEPVPREWSLVYARFSPRGKYVVIGTVINGGRQHLLHDATDGRRLGMRRFGAHCFSPDDRHLAVYANHTIRRWDLPDERGAQFPTAPFDEGLIDVSFDGAYVATGIRSALHREPQVPVVQVYSLSDGRPALGFDFPAVWFAFDPTGPRCAAVGSKHVKLYEQAAEVSG